MMPRISPTLRWCILAMAVETDRRQNLLRIRRSRVARRKYTNAFEDMTDEEFVKTFRLAKAQVLELIEDLTPLLPQQRRSTGLSPTLKILITLGFYASGSYQSKVGQNNFHCAAQGSVSRAVHQVTKALNDPSIFDKYIKWPSQQQERNHIKDKFYQYFGIPGVLGCIDGTHVSILKPSYDYELYHNRKGYHSLNVMVICDSDLNILCVDASSPGSNHDESIWKNHPLNQQLTELSNAGEQVFLLGDSGYPLQTTIMTPILNTKEGTPEHNYYIKHVTARNLVGRCIGNLKARFRCLLTAHTLHYTPDVAEKIVNACCVLHNIANSNKTPVTRLTSKEANAERKLQDTDPFTEVDEVESELQRGQALQQSLVKRMWTEI